MRFRLALALVVVALAAIGCTTGGVRSYHPEDDTSVYDDELATLTFDDFPYRYYEEQMRLSDGRTIRLFYSRSGDRLMEQHYSPSQDAWTSPRILLRSTEPDPCQGIDIVERDGVVAVIAWFGKFCYAGEPPDQSVAAVTTGDLTRWELHVTDDWDGWSKVSVRDQRVAWTGGQRSLSWTAENGFAGEPADATLSVTTASVQTP